MDTNVEPIFSAECKDQFVCPGCQQCSKWPQGHMLCTPEAAERSFATADEKARLLEQDALFLKTRPWTVADAFPPSQANGHSAPVAASEETDSVLGSYILALRRAGHEPKEVGNHRWQVACSLADHMVTLERSAAGKFMMTCSCRDIPAVLRGWGDNFEETARRAEEAEREGFESLKAQEKQRLKARKEAEAEYQAELMAADEEGDSWAAMDLGPYLRGEIKAAEPTLGIKRSDGCQLLYPGLEHVVAGETECGKSWLLLACALEEMLAGYPVPYIHFEEGDPSGTVERLMALGASVELIEKYLRFVGPCSTVTDAKIDKLVQKNFIMKAPRLVILDGVNEAMSLHRWGIRDEDGVAQFRRHIV
jgi:hypothetical protein